jgi:hypothetical protein
VQGLALIVGAICVAVGWHWKLMHRSWQDVRRVRNQAKGRIPDLKAVRAHHTSKAILFALIVVVLVIVVLH